MTPLRTTRYPRPRPVPSSPTLAALFQVIDDRGYTYPSIEARAGVAANSLSRIRSGGQVPSIATVERIADAIGVCLDLTTPSINRYAHPDQT